MAEKNYWKLDSDFLNSDASSVFFVYHGTID